MKPFMLTTGSGAAAFGLVVAAGDIKNYDVHRALLSDLPPPAIAVCADGGLRHAVGLGVMPDVILGDFDSADEELLAEYRGAGIPLDKHPADKDYTDTELAVRRAVLAVEQAAKMAGRATHAADRAASVPDHLMPTPDRAAAGRAAILCLGAFGGRIDHTVANLQLMYKYALRGVRIALADDHGIAAVLVPGGTLRIDRRRPAASLLDLLAYSGFSSNPAFSQAKISILPIGGAARGVSVTGLKYPLRDAELEACYTSGVSNEFASAGCATVGLREGAICVMICAD